MKPIILVTGPTRSGKSEWAEMLAQQTNLPVTYVATAQLDPDDVEWQTRIEQHQQRRPAHWQTLQVSQDLVATLAASTADSCLLIDSLGTWVANFLEEEQAHWQSIQQQFLVSLEQAAATVILVAEETGWGVVPAYPIGRRFRDRLGTLVRHTGAIANPVYLVTGGHVLNLSALGTPLSLLGQTTF